MFFYYDMHKESLEAHYVAEASAKATETSILKAFDQRMMFRGGNQRKIM